MRLANLSGLTNATRLAGRTLLWFMATSLIAVSVGLALGLRTDPASARRSRSTSTWGGRWWCSASTRYFVAGQALVPVLAARREGRLDESVYNGPACGLEAEPTFAPSGRFTRR